MSSFFMTAKDKVTGQKYQVFAIDDCFGKHEYGYRIGEKIYNEEDFKKLYER